MAPTVYEYDVYGDQEAEHHRRCRFQRERVLAAQVRIAALIEQAANRRVGRELNLSRPSMIVGGTGASLSCYGCDTTDRTYWQASYGGLVCVGETPDQAFQAFDEAWVHGTD